MIVKSLNDAKAGDYIPDGAISCNGVWHRQPFVILEEVTREDYIDSCKEECIPTGNIRPDDRFYRISID